MIAVYYTFHAKFHEIEEMYQPLLDLLVAARKSEGKVRVGTWTNVAFFRVEFLDNPKKELFEQLFHQSYAWRSDLFMDSRSPMKIVVLMDEVEQIVRKHLIDKGLKLKPGSGEPTSHTEGSYEDTVRVTDGIQFELE